MYSAISLSAHLFKYFEFYRWFSATGTTQDDDYVEGVVCKNSDIGENEMKSFELGEGRVLLVRQKGVLSALGAKCTHYGAPLAAGALGDGRVRCQWHGACFNILTGDIEDFPGIYHLIIQFSSRSH